MSLYKNASKCTRSRLGQYVLSAIAKKHLSKDRVNKDLQGKHSRNFIFKVLREGGVNLDLEFRCPHCNQLLFKMHVCQTANDSDPHIAEIKCRRCKTISRHAIISGPVGEKKKIRMTEQ